MQPEQSDILVAAMKRSADRFVAPSDAARDGDVMLREIVESAVAIVPGALHAGITTIDREGRISSTSPTAEVVARLDQAQAAMREGPCVSAVLSDPDAPHPEADTQHPEEDSGGHTISDRVRSSMVSVLDLRGSSMTSGGGRWPRFAGEAVRAGILSMLSFPLSRSRWPAAALNLYSDQPGAFDATGRTIAALFADQAAIALYGAENATDLGIALASRDTIGQAKGILMERHRLGPDDAFRLLVEASQNANLKLRDVAEWLVTEIRAPGSGRVDRGDKPDPSPVVREG